jgi:hypothetical protein
MSEPINLETLEAQFVTYEGDGRMGSAETVADAHGVMFLCPKCYAEHGGPVGTHRVICWFAGRGVPDSATPGPGRWEPGGVTLEDLSFVGPAAASVALSGGCGWHGFIRNGRATP